MKKTASMLLLLGMVVVGLGLAGSAFTVEAITVVLPETGTLPYGHFAWFSWEGGDSYDEVTLELYRQGGGVVVNTGSDTIWDVGIVNNTGNYRWTVSSDLFPADDYLLRVTAVGNSSVYDVSDATFGIAEDVDDDPQVVVTYPAGGETFTVGDTITITWTGMPAAYVAYVWMQQDGAGVKTGTALGNPGSRTWTFDANNTGTNFRFQIRSIVDSDNVGYSDVFSIQPDSGGITEPDPPEYDIALSQPDEAGERALTFTITGAPVGATGYRLYESGGLGFLSAVTREYPATTTTFTLRTDDDNLRRGHYVYYVLRAYNSKGEESSNSNWTHTFIPPAGYSYQIASPNGGEEYKPGDIVTVGWELEGYTDDDVAVLLTKGNVCEDALYNGEQSCGEFVEFLDLLDAPAPPIGGTKVGTKTYSWVIPDDIEPGADYRLTILVSAPLPPLGDPPFALLIDQSDAPFAIRSNPFTDGELIRASGDYRLFIYRNEALHHVPDYSTLAARRLDNTTVTVVDPSVLEDIPVGFSFMPEGALIRATNGVDIHIVKYAGQKQFRRLILNPQVFESYGHLRWEDVREVSQATVDAFPEATLVRVAGTNQIYRLTPDGDIGIRQRISETKLAAMGLDIESIYEINATDHASYTEGAALE